MEFTNTSLGFFQARGAFCQIPLKGRFEAHRITRGSHGLQTLRHSFGVTISAALADLRAQPVTGFHVVLRPLDIRTFGSLAQVL